MASELPLEWSVQGSAGILPFVAPGAVLGLAVVHTANSPYGPVLVTNGGILSGDAFYSSYLTAVTTIVAQIASRPGYSTNLSGAGISVVRLWDSVPPTLLNPVT